MNTTIKQKWVEALRSGEYKQTKSKLHDDEGFCCLGVLCDLYRKEHNDSITWKLVKDDIFKIVFQFNDNEGIPPKIVREWAGIENSIDDDNNPYGSYNEKRDSLVNDNDTGKTFEEIAQIIEEHF